MYGEQWRPEAVDDKPGASEYIKAPRSALIWPFAKGQNTFDMMFFVQALRTCHVQNVIGMFGNTFLHWCQATNAYK